MTIKSIENAKITYPGYALISNPKLRLVAFEDKHNEMVRTLRNTPNIYKWCRQSLLISDVDQNRWYEQITASPYIEMLGIADHSPSTTGYSLLGVCGLTDIHEVHRRAEFSLYINPQQQNKGYGTKALTLLFHYGFYMKGLHRIWGETFEGNPAMKIFEKMGMEKEGTRKEFYWKNGRFIDCNLISIGREQFDKYLDSIKE